MAGPTLVWFLFPFMLRKFYARHRQPGLHRVQAEELLDDQEQAEDDGQAGV